MTPFWKPALSDVARLVPEASRLEYVSSGGWKHVYSFEQDGRKWALMVVPLPDDTVISDGSELEDMCAKMRARVAREVSVIRKTDSPAMVKLGPYYDAALGCLETHLSGGTALWFTEEFIGGEVLSQLIADGYRPDISEILRLFLAVLDCIKSFKALGLVHRDIKPRNIIRVKQGDVLAFRLLDAGVAFDELSPRLTTIGRPMGTWKYMSPEQIAGDQVDWRSDLFSLAVTLFEFATCNHPFVTDNATVSEVVTSILMRTPIRLMELRTDMPRELSEVIGALMRKRPHLRPGDLGQLCDVLQPMGGGSAK